MGMDHALPNLCDHLPNVGRMRTRVQCELVYLRNHEQVLAPDASMVGMATITQSLLSLLSVCINFFLTIWLFNIAMENPS